MSVTIEHEPKVKEGSPEILVAHQIIKLFKKTSKHRLSFFRLFLNMAGGDKTDALQFSDHFNDMMRNQNFSGLSFRIFRFSHSSMEAPF